MSSAEGVTGITACVASSSAFDIGACTCAAPSMIVMIPLRRASLQIRSTGNRTAVGEVMWLMKMAFVRSENREVMRSTMSSWVLTGTGISTRSMVKPRSLRSSSQGRAPRYLASGSLRSNRSRSRRRMFAAARPAVVQAVCAHASLPPAITKPAYGVWQGGFPEFSELGWL